MNAKYPNVFKPIKIGPLEIKNRFYQSPHIIPHTSPQGAPSEDACAYVAERAKGGVGLVMTSMSVPARGRGVLPTPHLKENIPAFRKLADAVHAAGAKYIVELWYHWGRPGVWAPWSPPGPIMAPSPVQFNNFEKRIGTREMSLSDIKTMIEAFKVSAANLREAGFDGIMHHASHGAILEQFLSPYFNRRTDAYGGNFDKRMRMLIETLEQTREACGDKMAVGIRLNCDELLEGGYDTKESYQVLKRLSDAGLIDFADLDVAVEPDQFHLGMPSVFITPHVYRPYVEAVRSAAGKVPVLSVLGRLTSVADGDAAISAGVCDMVGAARALIAEPNLVKYAQEGTEELGRTCIACNWCMAGLYDAAQTCTVNPVAWRERAWGEIPPAAKKSKVVVVGGGPGGMEAARTAALRGHDVVLFEARDKLGGGLLLWSQLPGREFYKKGVDWWEREIKRLGVKVHLGAKATAVSVLAEKPDAVVLATGAVYSVGGHSNHRDLDIEGYDQSFVYRPEEILLGTANPKGKIVMLDGEGLHAGVGIGEALCLAGHDVEYLTPHFSPVSPRVEAALEVPPLMKRLRDAGLKITPTTYIKRIGNREVTVYDIYSEKERVIKDVDAVILSTGRVSVNDLEKELEGKVAQVFTIGDALAARMFATAAYEAHKFTRFIGEPNAPASVSQVYFTNDMQSGWL